MLLEQLRLLRLLHPTMTVSQRAKVSLILAKSVQQNELGPSSYTAPSVPFFAAVVGDGDPTNMPRCVASSPTRSVHRNHATCDHAADPRLLRQKLVEESEERMVPGPLGGVLLKPRCNMDLGEGGEFSEDSFCSDKRRSSAFPSTKSAVKCVKTLCRETDTYGSTKTLPQRGFSTGMRLAGADGRVSCDHRDSTANLRTGPPYSLPHITCTTVPRLPARYSALEHFMEKDQEAAVFVGAVCHWLRLHSELEGKALTFIRNILCGNMETNPSSTKSCNRPKAIVSLGARNSRSSTAPLSSFSSGPPSPLSSSVSSSVISSRCSPLFSVPSSSKHCPATVLKSASSAGPTSITAVARLIHARKPPPLGSAASVDSASPLAHGQGGALPFLEGRSSKDVESTDFDVATSALAYIEQLQSLAGSEDTLYRPAGVWSS